MTRRRKNRLARWIATVLLIAGAIAIAISGGAFLGLNLWEKWQNRAFDRVRTAANHGEKNHGEANHAQTRHVENGEIVGRLSIPRLRVRAIIREGTTNRTLAVALGHIEGTAMPGDPGNMGIAGHRDTLFRALRNVRNGDDITFETTRETWFYRVEKTMIVGPTDVAVLNAGRARELTLVTCYPFDYVGAAPKRFIVKAELLSESVSPNNIPERPLREVAAPVAAPKPRPKGEISFEVPRGHNRQLVPGKVWFGVDSVDAESHTASGWLWVMPERQTIWLRNRGANEPVVFNQDGAMHELMITGVNQNSVRGRMLPLAEHNRGF